MEMTEDGMMLKSDLYIWIGMRITRIGRDRMRIINNLISSAMEKNFWMDFRRMLKCRVISIDLTKCVRYRN